MFQHLESRRLFAVTIVASSDSDVLRITGTAQADHIELYWLENGSIGVSEDGTLRVAFEPGKIRLVSFAGLGGNDIFSAGRVNVRTYLNGGDGNDALAGSVRSDNIVGGAGDDYCFGAAGADTLSGDDGADTLVGGTDDDLLYAKSANTDDYVTGGAGRDTLSLEQYTQGVILHVGETNQDMNVVSDIVLGDIETVVGSAYNDAITVYSGRAMRLVGGAGNDTLIGGRGTDVLQGGIGSDVLYGNGGDDFLDGSDDNNIADTLDGGSGANTAKTSTGSIDTATHVQVIAQGSVGDN